MNPRMGQTQEPRSLRRPSGYRRAGVWLLTGGVLLAALVGALIWVAHRPGGNDAKPDDESPTGPAWFSDVTANSGIDFTFKNGADMGHLALLEMGGGGVALFDYDGDGL